MIVYVQTVLNPDPHIESCSRDPEAVAAFFNGWSLYRRIVDNDYLYHRSVKASIGEWLDGLERELGRPFSFLDLGCGDGLFSSEILEGRSLSGYTGMDISPVALDLAEQNTRQIKAPCTLKIGDFLTEITSLPDTYDIIYIGLSLHHLPRTEKEFFFGELRLKLAPCGALVIFDPVLTPGETHDSYMGRWVDHAEWAWNALTAEEVAGAIEHVTSSDYPEEIGTLNRLAALSGLEPAEVLFMDQTDFYALMVFRTNGHSS